MGLTRKLGALLRREFLAQSCRWASAGLLSAQLRGRSSPLSRPPSGSAPKHELDDRFIPHYHQPSPLEDVLRNVEPGFDALASEKYAEQLELVLAQWSAEICEATGSSDVELAILADSISPNLKASSLNPAERRPLRPTEGLEVYANRFNTELTVDRSHFLDEFKSFLAVLGTIVTAEFEITEILLSGAASSPALLQTHVRYDLVGTGKEFFRAQRVGTWALEWESDAAGRWRVRKWQAGQETESRASGPVFRDITAHALRACNSYTQQLVQGTDHWRTVLDGASRIDVYGNNGICVGDFDGDGFDDVYVCQPAGLPNRLYRNRGDGTFEDATDKAGVGVLDNTACALFADLSNSGRQDLIVVCVDGPLLFLNRGEGRFQFKPDAFRFDQAPQGTFTGAAVADYDRDGLLDIYFCLYSYYAGLNQYQYPLPYYDAQNGPPNFLMHNRGDGTFVDVTAATGMNVNNNRYSFTCGWTDFDQDGRPDLYVVNDFGRKNLYRNNGDGTFTDVAREAGVDDVGAGMSVCWFDYNNDGRQDLYVADMWSAAGERVTADQEFAPDAPGEVRALLRKHASGNSLLHNEGQSHFKDASAAAGTQMGRWSWSSDAWDFDHDGYPDIYIANGMISGRKRHDLSSFFWRQVVASTPVNASGPARQVPSPRYARAWNAINELIRSDGTWAGYQRNNFYANNRDGTFSEMAGAARLDFIEDSRAFALADFDHDGRLEIFLKNRSGPQVRILHNELRDIGRSIAFRLYGRECNRDAIGAAVEVESPELRQTKFVQAGSGFLSQHTKDVYFGLGLGKIQGPVQARIRWPDGRMQSVTNVPPEHLVIVQEGRPGFRAEPFRPRTAESGSAELKDSAGGSTIVGEPPVAASPEPLSGIIETWLLVPIAAPDFSLDDFSGHKRQLADFRGDPLLLSFWEMGPAGCETELDLFERQYPRWTAAGLQLATVNLNSPNERDHVRHFLRERHYSFAVLFADEDTAAVYNILYTYLFDRRRDLALPTSLLLDAGGLIVKVYQGSLKTASVQDDIRELPRTNSERYRKGLPFQGRLYGDDFHRNQFTYATVFLERGYPDQALAACRLVLEREPGNAEAHYLEGMAYLKKNMAKQARESFEQTLRCQASYPDTVPNAWNNLGMLAAQQGDVENATAALNEAIRLNPGYTVALENLGNLYRQQHRWAEAQSLLERALKIDPSDAEVNYSLGMTFAQQGATERAESYLNAALKLRPAYPEALNNLGVLYLRTQRIDSGVSAFETCIRVAPAFDQAYINLAKVYALRGETGQAAAILHELLRRHPDHVAAKELLAELGR